MCVCGGGGRGPDPPRKSPVCLEILVGTPGEKQMDPSGPIASRGRFVDYGPL